MIINYYSASIGTVCQAAVQPAVAVDWPSWWNNAYGSDYVPPEPEAPLCSVDSKNDDRIRFNIRACWGKRGGWWNWLDWHKSGGGFFQFFRTDNDSK